MITENLINSLRDQAEPHGNCLLSRAANELERLTSPAEVMSQWWRNAEVPTEDAPIAEGDWVIERSHEGSWGLFRAYRAIDGSYMSESLRSSLDGRGRKARRTWRRFCRTCSRRPLTRGRRSRTRWLDAWTTRGSRS